MVFVCTAHYSGSSHLQTDKGWHNGCAVCELERLQAVRKMAPLVADRILKGMLFALIPYAILTLANIAESIWSATR